MSTSRHLPWHPSHSADAPNPVAQPNDHNNVRRPGTPPRVSPDRAASGPSRDRAIMTNGLTSKPIPASRRTGRSFAPSREPRITNRPPASHASRRTTTAKESTTSPRPHRVTLLPAPAALWRTPAACRAGLSPASALGHRPMTPPSAPASDTGTDKQSMAKPTHRAQSASDGLGRIASPAPQPLPALRTHLGPTPTTHPNLPHLTESAISTQTAPKTHEQTQSNRQNNGGHLNPCRRMLQPHHRPNPIPPPWRNAQALPGRESSRSRTTHQHPMCPRPPKTAERTQ